MVLIGKIVNTPKTCLLFKYETNRTRPLNTFAACPWDLLKENDYKILIRVVGNKTVRLQTPIYVTAHMLTVQHTFLYYAIGIENPQVINDTPELLEISYFR